MEKYFTIPHTDITISRVGLGTVNAGLSWDCENAYRLLDAFIDYGGSLIDCARVYSDWIEPEIGRAERVLGDWIRHRGHHHDFTLITKCAHPRMDSMNVSRASRGEIESDLNLSLKALGVDCIDIYCFHRDDEARTVEELVETMERLVKAGKIRYYACSNWSVSRIREADAYCHKAGYRGFVLNEALYNYGSQDMKPLDDPSMLKADDEMLQYHAQNTDNVLTPYMGLCSAFFHILSAKGEQAVQNSPYHTATNLNKMQIIQKIAQAHGVGVSEVLLGYLLTREPCMLPLASADNEQQLHEVMNVFQHAFHPSEFH